MHIYILRAAAPNLSGLTVNHRVCLICGFFSQDAGVTLSRTMNPKYVHVRKKGYFDETSCKCKLDNNTCSMVVI